LSSYRSVLKFGAFALAAGLMLGVVACSDDDDNGSTSASTATPAAEATEAPDSTGATGATGSTGADEATVAVTAVDYEFEGLPDSVDAGTTFTITNESEAEAHELVAILLPEDETRSAEELLALPEEELGELAQIEPAFVIIAGPGEEGMAVLGDGSLTEPGRYLFACFIPLGADPEEFLDAPEGTGTEGPPEVEGGPPHFTEGMFGEVTVE
jgi:hypothetical protein